MIFPLGNTEITKREDLANALRTVSEMHKAGHAIEIYGSYDEHDKFLSAICTHNLTCRACAEIQRKR